MVTVGFTGTRKGMTPEQKDTVQMVLSKWLVDEVHHGDCIGADEDFHRISECMGYKIIIHPPKNSRYRAYCGGPFRPTHVLPEKDYLDRNRDIVDASDVLIATPNSYRERIRSGTWYTIRYAGRRGKRVIIVYPSGCIDEEN
ncbi:MAG: hypothetical protein ACTSPB_03210 [Candidatus Thorarchaeota archaeon]